MDKVLYISTAGASLVMKAQQVHANNLSNTATAGFRKDFVRSLGVAMEGDGLGTRVMPVARGLGSRFSQGIMETTGRPLDIAIMGDGWLSVETPDGNEAYTRSGQLKVNEEGALLTSSGLPLIGEGGPIELPPYRSLEIGMDGTITIIPEEVGAAPEEVGQLKLVNPDLQTIRKGADGLFRALDGEAADADPAVQLRTGFLEGSNVNALEEMVSFLSLSRQFEAQMKLMKAAGDMASSGDRLMRDQ